MFKQCPQKYAYRYIEGIKPPPREDAAARGLTIHGAVEQFFLTGEDVLDDHLEHFADELRAIKAGRGGTPEKQFFLTRDFEYVATRPERGVVGYLDLVLDDNVEEINVLEFKTGKIYGDHADQRDLYALAALAMYPLADRVKVIGMYFDLEKTEETVLTRDEFSVHSQRWIARFKQMDNTALIFADPGFYCRWCPYSKNQQGPCKFG